jgi:hypothetical protein
MSLDHQAASRIREFRHLFAAAGLCDHPVTYCLRFQPGVMSCIDAWEGQEETTERRIVSEFKSGWTSSPTLRPKQARLSFIFRTA